MPLSPLAGKPAPPEILIDVDRLIGAYYDRRPDPTIRAQLVSFGTSGHRGAARDGTFNEAHILAITQAICEYRARAGITGPLFMGKDTHAVSAPAQRTALEVLAANGVDTRVQRRRRLHADAGDLARDPRVQPRARRRRTGWPTASSSRRRTTRRATAASSTTRPTAAPPTPTSPTASRTRANELLRGRRRRQAHAVRAARRERASTTRASTTSCTPYVDDLADVIDMEAIARVRACKLGVDPLGGAAVHVLGAHRRALTAWT